MKKMMRIVLVVLLLLMIGSLFAAKKSKFKFEMKFDESLMGAGQQKSLALASWMSYCYPIQKDMNMFYESNPTGQYIKPFNIEVSARTSMVNSYRTMFTNMKLTEAEKDEYLEDLGKVIDSGFIKEYVFKYLNDGTWVAPEGLKLDDFDKWISIELPKHQVKTLASVNKVN